MADAPAAARHFVGIGVGCTSLTSFVVGTEFAPRSSATALKAGWSYWSGIGGILQSLFAKVSPWALKPIRHCLVYFIRDSP